LLLSQARVTLNSPSPLPEWTWSRSCVSLHPHPSGATTPPRRRRRSQSGDGQGARLPRQKRGLTKYTKALLRLHSTQETLWSDLAPARWSSEPAFHFWNLHAGPTRLVPVQEIAGGGCGSTEVSRGGGRPLPWPALRGDPRKAGCERVDPGPGEVPRDVPGFASGTPLPGRCLSLGRFRPLALKVGARTGTVQMKRRVIHLLVRLYWLGVMIRLDVAF
jgi:hypothetical protein